MQQTVVRSAIESQLKEQTKQITDEIKNKKKKEPTLFDGDKDASKNKAGNTKHFHQKEMA